MHELSKPYIIIFVLTIFALAGRAQAQTSWPADVVADLPGSLAKPVSEYVRVDNASIETLRDQISTADDPDYIRIRIAASDLLQTREGAEALLSAMAREPDVNVRLAIAESFANSRMTFALVRQVPTFPELAWPRHELAPDVSRALEREVLRAQSPKNKREFADYFLAFQSGRLIGPLNSAIYESHDTAREAELDDLRYDVYRLFFDGAPARSYFETFPHREVPVGEDDTVKVIAFGDLGKGNSDQLEAASTIAKMHSANPFDFGITLGDHFPPYGVSGPSDERWDTEWENIYGGLGITFYPALGNHDVHMPNGALSLFQRSNLSDSWDMPGANYSVRAGPAEFFVLDTHLALSSQLDWLETRLSKSTAPWKIVYSHWPIKSSGFKADHEPHDLIDRLLPVLKRGGATAYFSGGDHAMEEYAPQEGVHLFTVGTGGAGRYEVEMDEESIFRVGAVGFAVIEASPDHFTIRFIDQYGSVLHERFLSRD